MKRTLTLVALVACAFAAVAQTYVQGYTRKDGTYVEGHYRSSPNSTTLDNYSTRGNTNPYTGKEGTIDPYATPTYGQSCHYTRNGNYVCR